MFLIDFDATPREAQLTKANIPNGHPFDMDFTIAKKSTRIAESEPSAYSDDGSDEGRDFDEFSDDFDFDSDLESDEDLPPPSLVKQNAKVWMLFDVPQVFG